MERQSLPKRAAILLLTLCLLGTTLLGIIPVPAAAETTETTVYYLDSDNWGSVNAYVYGDSGEVLGGWPGTAATVGEDGWAQITVTAETAFSVIFNGSGGQSADSYIGTVGGTYYVTKDGTHHASKEAAEEYMNPTPKTTVYYLDSDNWGSVNAYVYGDSGEVLGGWPGTAAAVGEDGWAQITVTAETAFSIIFNGGGAQSADIYIGTVGGTYYVTKDGTHHASKEAAEEYMNPTEPEKVPTDIYFLNSNNWAGVGVYIYGDKGELVGSWGSTTAAADDGSWVKVNVPDAPPFSIIFYNTADDSQRAELYLGDAANVYVTVHSVAFASKAEAEASIAPAEPEPEDTCTLYFLNSNGWENVGVYIYGDKGELAGSWGTTTATADSGNWVKVDVSAEPPYSVIFYNIADDTQRAELLLDAADKVYVTVNAEAFTTKEAAEASVAPEEPEPDPDPVETYDLYFLNSNGWENVGAYIYGDKGELLGSWGTTTAVAAPEVGENWVKVSASAAPPYSVIFYNTADDTQRAELLLDAADKVYVTVRAQAFSTREEAEASMAPVEMHDVYFLNSKNWETVGAYIYGDQGELLGSWGTATAVPAEELGGKWVKVSVPGEPPYSIIFYNKADDTQRAELLLESADKIYVTVNSRAYASQKSAENSLKPAQNTNPPETPKPYTVYFLNSEGWDVVGAYIYGDKGELLGPWGSTTAVAAPEIGENWMKVAVSAEPPYSIIFYNAADDTQRAELFIDSADKIYVTAKAVAAATKEDAEKSLEPAGEFEIYFLNSSGWAEVGAYIYGEKGELLGSWGSTDAIPAPELGEDWMKVTVTALPPYSIIFYNKADETQRAELLLDAEDKIYVTAGNEAFTTQADAEAAAGVTAAIDPNNRNYGPGVEVIETMEGKPVQAEEPKNDVSWLIPAGGISVAALAGAAWLLLKKKKAA